MDFGDVRRMLRGLELPEHGFDDLLARLEAAERVRMLRRPSVGADRKRNRAA